ncbi:MAG: YpdA family putative bacillithiol disulfide reductase [Thermoanaerobaculia bacterium]
MKDLLVVGAGPTGIAIGADAKRAGLEVLLVDRGPLCGALVQFPTGMTFFTTRDRLEIAGIPFGIPEDKPNRRQALAYYQGVARQYELPLALYEDVIDIRQQDEVFVVSTRHDGGERERHARAVALATGYFDLPQKLGVPGEDLPWVHRRYLEPYPHFGQHVVIVGGGNSACETALDLWRNHVRVTMVVRKPSLKPTVKYWVKPDAENRIAEGSISGRFDTEVKTFRDRGIEIEHRGRRETLAADAVYVLIGYLPDAGFERRCGIEVDSETLVPAFDPETCESNVPGLYIAGTLQAGRDTGRIFIENSRAHAPKIVRHLARRLRASSVG